MDTPIVERSAFREIFDCGGTLYSMDAARISNLDKAHENAQAFAAEVRRLLPIKVIRSQEPRRLLRLVRNAA
jgi:chromosome partitioning protein